MTECSICDDYNVVFMVQTTKDGKSPKENERNKMRKKKDKKEISDGRKEKLDLSIDLSDSSFYFTLILLFLSLSLSYRKLSCSFQSFLFVNSIHSSFLIS